MKARKVKVDVRRATARPRSWSSTNASAWQAAAPLRRQLERTLQEKIASDEPAFTVRSLIEHYRAERMPRRAMTQQGYNTWLNQHIVPKWGDCAIQQLQARPVDLWLRSLDLSPKSKVHIRGLLRILWDFAMWRGDMPIQRNPMELVTVKGATRRGKKPRSLAVEEFPVLLRQLSEPFCTMAVLCLCFGLRISECLALRWSDVDWFNGTLCVERGIVHQVVDDVKTPESERVMHIEPEVLSVLKSWKLQTQFSDPVDWIFASPAQVGRLPFSYAGVWQAFRKAAARAGIRHIGSHSFRHTFRSWLDVIGTPVGVQKRLMRHTDIRTTMGYGTQAEGVMRQAQEKIVRMALIPA